MAKENDTSASRIDMMLAFLCIKDIDGLSDQVAILDRFGFTSIEISKLCGVVEGSVRNARMQSKKAKPKAKIQNVKSK